MFAFRKTEGAFRLCRQEARQPFLSVRRHIDAPMPRVVVVKRQVKRQRIRRRHKAGRPIVNDGSTRPPSPQGGTQGIPSAYCTNRIAVHVVLECIVFEPATSRPFTLRRLRVPQRSDDPVPVPVFRYGALFKDLGQLLVQRINDRFSSALCGSRHCGPPVPKRGQQLTAISSGNGTVTTRRAVARYRVAGADELYGIAVNPASHCRPNSIFKTMLAKSQAGRLNCSLQRR